MARRSERPKLCSIMRSHTRLTVTIGVAPILTLIAGCVSSGTAERAAMQYQVKRIEQPVAVDADWNKPTWQAIETLELTHFMGDRPEHFPRTQAKLAYDDRHIYVIFRVEDRYVRATAKKHQDRVCCDSCVEFFFTPGTDLSTGYFNLEMNCGGTMLLHHQIVPRQNSVPLAASDLERIQVAHVLPPLIDPEIAESTTWVVEYRLPIEMLERYCERLRKPAPGVRWRANFFKCADGTSHPHWLTWAPVDNPRPDFHLPRFFGTLEFE